MATLQFILDWSEVWALLLPLSAILLKKQQPLFLKPVIVYVGVAFVLNLTIDIISDFHRHFPTWPHSNTFLYNIQSIVRFFCFSYFFILLRGVLSVKIPVILSLIYFLFFSINFSFVENFFDSNRLSGNLLAIEAYILLIYCLLYYLSQLQSEVQELREEKDFWIVTGLSIYVVINFFIFLFYVPMIAENPPLANRMWNIHNVAYIVLCLFITKAYYVPVRPES